MKKFTLLFVFILFFYPLGILTWQLTGEIFFLFNFLTIGTSLGLGISLFPVFPKNKQYIARLISQVLVGGYMLFGLGFGLIWLVSGQIMPENIQIEGFWFSLLSGIFKVGVIHYLVAKIFGPLLFNRGWCGWACWTVGVLDLLPWKYNKKKRPEKYWNFRYIHFFLNLLIVFILFFAFEYGTQYTLPTIEITQNLTFGESISKLLHTPTFFWFLIGNILYYFIGIILAVCLKDNRAFCKYVCPITVFLKIGSRYSMLKVDKTEETCTECKLCEKRCPMDIKIVDYLKAGTRVSSSECIVCQTCISNCPHDVLKLSFRLSDKIKS